jgi:hypothetical protein
MDPRQVYLGKEITPKKDKDWTFDDVLRDKLRRRGY